MAGALVPGRPTNDDGIPARTDAPSVGTCLRHRQLCRGRASATTIAAKLRNAHCSAIKHTNTDATSALCRETRLADIGRAENQICPYRARRRARTQASPGATANSRNCQWSFDRRAWRTWTLPTTTSIPHPRRVSRKRAGMISSKDTASPQWQVNK